jgi:hypothetical protein
VILGARGTPSTLHTRRCPPRIRGRGGHRPRQAEAEGVDSVSPVDLLTGLEQTTLWKVRAVLDRQ